MKPAAAALLLLVAPVLLRATAVSASWVDGEVLVGQAQAANDALSEAAETLGEGLGEARSALGTVVAAKNGVLSNIGGAVASLADDAVATTLGSQAAVSGLLQNGLNAGGLLARRIASGVGGAVGQVAEQPGGVVSAFNGGLGVAGGLSAPEGVFGGALPTVQATRGVLQQSGIGVPGNAGVAPKEASAAKDAAIAGLASALMAQQQPPQVALVDGGDGFAVPPGVVPPPVVLASGGVGGGAVAPVLAAAAAGGPPAPPPDGAFAAQQRLYAGVTDALAGALRAVPVVRGASVAPAFASAPALASAPAFAAAPAPAYAPVPAPAVQQMQGLVPTAGLGDLGGLGGAGAIVPPVGLDGAALGAGAIGAGAFAAGAGGDGAVSIETSTPVEVETPVTVDTPVRQSNQQQEGPVFLFGGLGGGKGRGGGLLGRRRLA